MSQTAASPVITVDGPSGVGKGTVSRWLARRLGWHWLDSGALYRLAALHADRLNLVGADPARLGDLCAHLPLVIVEQEGEPRFVLDGEDVSTKLRAEAVAGLASRLSVFPEVRAGLLSWQRTRRQPPGLVADGRDMGTVVFPDAGLKLFLDASAEERARRRWVQLRQAGVDARLDDLSAEVRERDERDRTRSVAPLRPAEGAVIIDTTHLSPAAVEARIASLLERRSPGAA
jgi:cytidylate kinase (EC 2.7.4.14)